MKESFFKKHPRAEKVTIAVVVVLVLLSIAGAVFIQILNASPFDDAEFDAVVWKSEGTNTSFENLRGPMTEDLRQRILKKGMNRNEIVALLGSPDAADREGFLSYWLGAWSDDRFEFNSLDLHLDRSNRLESSIIQKH